MGGHGGLNILPQKSWNVYGQRNRQKVAEDEAADREKQAKDHEQRTRGDRVSRVNVLRTQSNVQEPLDDPLQTDEQPAPQQLRHVNFWSEHEAANRNPEAEAEKAAQLRKRGDPRTQTSDARFDERFAVLHGHTGQAPWYARHSPSLYSDNPAALQHDRSPALASLQSLNRTARLNTQCEASTPLPRHRIHVARTDLAKFHRRDAAFPRAAEAIGVAAAMPGGRDSSATADHADGSASSARAPDVAVPSLKEQRAHSPIPSRRSYSKCKQSREKKHKKSSKEKHRSKQRSRKRSRSRSPAGRHHEKDGRCRTQQRRPRSQSAGGKSSSSSDSGGSLGVAVRDGQGCAADGVRGTGGFEALRRERLERERMEALRSQVLLKEHYRSR